MIHLQEFTYRDGCWRYVGDSEPEARRVSFARKEIAFKVVQENGRWYATLVELESMGKSGRVRNSVRVGDPAGYASEGLAEAALDLLGREHLKAGPADD